MTFVPVPQVAQVEVVFNYANQITENVYHVLGTLAFDASDLAALAGEFETWWKASLRTKHTPNCTLVNIKARAMDDPTSPAIEHGVTVDNAGTRGGTALPNNVAIAVKWITGLSGRSFRGRTYHQGLSSSDILSGSSNVMDPTALGALQVGYQALISVAFTNGGQLVVVSKTHDKAPRATGVATPIIGCTIDSTLDSQRRRLPGRGS